MNVAVEAAHGRTLSWMAISVEGKHVEVGDHVEKLLALCVGPTLSRQSPDFRANTPVLALEGAAIGATRD
jgi:hypothetical protein